ncbi:asparagine synthase-related protein [Cognatiluteimonas lumbrici]|uniref:asparagine synthase-related protein n=1 Tax=Cognatiluteimonas lumbrici TaxID=2559601 RepID=UPI00112DE618|nr:asparagine synthase C-terminal domain-containing protein [Luteimonas lumbrici]
MGCRYILLLGEPAADSRDETSVIPGQLRAMGMQERHSCAGATLYASPGTPTLRVPGGGIVIGHLFRPDGMPLHEQSAALASLDANDAGRWLARNCWGEYLLVQPARDNGLGPCITRDPSGGVACVHSIRDAAGFATSDISIAERLGLFERRVDRDFIAQFLAYPYMKSARTGLSGIRELLPGCTLHVHRGDATTSRTWSPWDFVAPARRQRDIVEAASGLRDVIERTVGAWAGVDGTALVELSGGLDSSIVAACLQGKAARIHCATLIPALPGADERMYAAPVARSLGAELSCEPLDVDNARFDAPVPPWCVTPGIAPLQHAVDGIMEGVAAREGFDSLYSGGGGDTVFGFLGGAAPAADAFRERGVLAGLRAVDQLSELHQCTFWLAARLALRKLAKTGAPRRPADGSLLDPSVVPDASEPHPWREPPCPALPGDLERIEGLAGTQLFRDAVPRAMRRCLRLPLLSQPVMETCLSIPSWMWIDGGRNRAVARMAFSDALPSIVLQRRSKGDFAQYNGAVYRRNKDAMRRFLMDGELRAMNLLDTNVLDTFFDRPLGPRDQSYMRVVDLCRAENWIRHQS